MLAGKIVHDLAQPFFCLALPYAYGYGPRLLTNEIETQKLMVVDGFKQHEPFFLGRSNSLTARAWHQVF